MERTKFFALYNYIKLNIRLNYLRPMKAVFVRSKNGLNVAEMKREKKMIVMQTPLHDNMGDHAIAYAQRKFLEDHFSDYAYIEIPFDDVVRTAKRLRKALNKEDIIFIHGGGNIGDMYLWEEYTRRYIIKHFKNNPIISFPQTMSFSSGRIGEIERRKTKKLYKRNRRLYLLAREMKSYEVMRKTFGESKVFLTPDIVLSLDERADKKREGVLACFRSDGEKATDDQFNRELIEDLRKKHKRVELADTAIKRRVTLETREGELNAIWDKFRTAEVVLTDRLHGMIFCAITCTPCVVFKNTNHKIECSYNDWLSGLRYIRFVDVNKIKNVNEIGKMVEDLRNLDNKELHLPDLKEKFAPLTSLIHEENGAEHLMDSPRSFTSEFEVNR